MILVIVEANSKMMRKAVFYSKGTFTGVRLCALEDCTVLNLSLFTAFLNTSANGGKSYINILYLKY